LTIHREMRGPCRVKFAYGCLHDMTLVEIRDLLCLTDSYMTPSTAFERHCSLVMLVRLTTPLAPRALPSLHDLALSTLTTHQAFAMQPVVHELLANTMNTTEYIIVDPSTKHAAIIDPVLDTTSTSSPQAPSTAAAPISSWL